MSAPFDRDRSAVYEEALEIFGFLQRLEDWTGEPIREVDRVLNPVVERHVDPELATELGSNNCG
jgi:hypothetical protein